MCPEEGGAAGLGELRSWWEVPAIAHFCSLFRTAFRLPDFEIEVSGRPARGALSPSALGAPGTSCGRERGARDLARSREPEDWRAGAAALRTGPERGRRARDALPSGRGAHARSGEAAGGRREAEGASAFVGVGPGRLSRDLGGPSGARVRARAPRRCH